MNEKTYLRTYTPIEDSIQPAIPPSDQSLRCSHEETLHAWVSKMRPVRILIRLRNAQAYLNIRCIYISAAGAGDVGVGECTTFFWAPKGLPRRQTILYVRRDAPA